ncbi:MAG: hypothetical protein KDJ34_14070 [Candidatus Competibacteraceae bacterium]|nr:hypothetical protein [Candidatus Competibacteraceae bacterium]
MCAKHILCSLYLFRRVHQYMPTFNISAAARAVGTSRASIQRAIKSGRLSATTNEQDERVIDLSELLRVFGPLKHGEQANMDASMDGEQRDTPSMAVHEHGLVKALREHLDDAREQLQLAQEEKRHLLTMLEVEQAARRELETKLLPAPVPPSKLAPPSHRWVWLLLILLVAVLAFAGWRWRDAIHATVAALVN